MTNSDVLPNLVDARFQGSEVVPRWNALSDEQRQAAGPLVGIDLAGASLPGVNLGGLDLHEARLEGADLSGAWLLECNLARAQLDKARLDRAWCAEACFQQANLQGATLLRANLRGCDLREACLAGANLDGATLDGADLRGTDLSGAILRNASLARARYDARTRFPSCFQPRQAMEWTGTGPQPIALDVFIRRLDALVDSRRLGRAIEMLKAESFQLYHQVEVDEILGVVRSQTDEEIVYSCQLDADGRFACCSQDLQPCLGMRNALCKHLLVLIVGLTRAGLADAATVLGWVERSKGHRPHSDAATLSEPLLRYQAARMGEVDWRPTETIPEDYYTL